MMKDQIYTNGESAHNGFSIPPDGVGIPDSWPTASLRATIRSSRAFFKGKRVLVTGAFGFVGGHLSRALHVAGASIVALDCDTSPQRASQLNLIGLRHEI